MLWRCERVNVWRLAVKMDKHLPSADAFSKALARYQTTSPRWSAILKSWREHPSKNDLWRAFQEAAIEHGKSLPEPAEFIGVVLGSTMPAKRLNDHNDHVLKRFESLKREIGTVVSDASSPLNLWQELEKFEEPLRELDRSAYDMHRPAGGRKDQDGSRDRKTFAQRMFRYLQNACGEPLPRQVNTMLDIVFPSAEPHNERLVREWLPKTPKPFV